MFFLGLYLCWWFQLCLGSHTDTTMWTDSECYNYIAEFMNSTTLFVGCVYESVSNLLWLVMKLLLIRVRGWFQTILWLGLRTWRSQHIDPISRLIWTRLWCCLAQWTNKQTIRLTPPCIGNLTNGRKHKETEFLFIFFIIQNIPLTILSTTTFKEEKTDWKDL